MQQLANKIVLITGGTSGIGFAAARLFQQHGARVIATGIDEEAAERARLELGRDAWVVTSDTSKAGDLDALVAGIGERYGHLDVVFANAGLARFAPLEATTEESFDRMMAVNVKGPLLLVQRALPILRPGASIILTTSGVNAKGYPMTSAYAASKAALRSLARTMSTELIGRGIRVNALSPGGVDTPIYRKLGLPAEAHAQLMKTIVGGTPLGRLADPSELAEAALYLASDASRFMVGAELVIDGGMTQL